MNILKQQKKCYKKNIFKGLTSSTLCYIIISEVKGNRKQEDKQNENISIKKNRRKKNVYTQKS